jgi:aspartate/tyrosine/aromatic aminotransferase
MAVSWDEQAILLGEAKWTTKPVGVPVLESLKEKVPAAIPDPSWTVHYALFSWSGFTPPFERLAAKEGVRLVSLEEVIASV